MSLLKPNVPVRRMAWITDPHLNFLSIDQIHELLDKIQQAAVDLVVVSGDIAESRDLLDHLVRFDGQLQHPFYFVLGNHDFYYGSIARVRERVAELCGNHKHLCYLTGSPPVRLNSRVGLIGHDGWADGRLGDYANSPVMLQDYTLIAEFYGLDKRQRLQQMHTLGDEAAAHIRLVLPTALKQFEHVYLLTHVPPMREACWHEGRISDDDWSPHFSCHVMGQAILEIMRQHPEKRLTVLCGHTHGEGTIAPLENVVIHTGAAEYGWPALTRIFEIA